jgi:2-amino-4-hydroxy-6-hydroxymethyldihydropteridine diphosphokinase
LLKEVNPADFPGEGLSGAIAYIGIGANIGSPAAQCREAIQKLDETEGIKVLRSSSLYRTEPIGMVDQNWFINAVSEVKTTIAPRNLLNIMKDIERLMGRKERPRWCPRLIDLDLLLYGQRIIDEEGLKVPHPEFHKRRFVLEPLCEIASYVIHPLYNVSARGLLSRLPKAESRVFKIVMRDE